MSTYLGDTIVGRSALSKMQASHYEILNKIGEIVSYADKRSPVAFEDLPSIIETAFAERQHIRERVAKYEVAIKQLCEEYFLQKRGIDTETIKLCPDCDGSGVMRFSIKGWRVNSERKVCQKCWGSGIKDPWPSHNNYYIMEVMCKGGESNALEFLTVLEKDLSDSQRAPLSPWQKSVLKNCRLILKVRDEQG